VNLIQLAPILYFQILFKMKKNIILLSAFALTGVSAYSQGIIAGWDFSKVANLSGAVGNYEAEYYSGSNNGVSTTGYIYTSGDYTSTNFAQNPSSSAEVRFLAAGRQATGEQALNGFDQATTNNIGTTSNGQLGLEFLNVTSNYQFVVGFSSAFDVKVYFDYSNTVGSGDAFGDFLNISYSADGVNWTAYAPNSGSSTAGTNSYAAF